MHSLAPKITLSVNFSAWHADQLSNALQDVISVIHSVSDDQSSWTSPLPQECRSTGVQECRITGPQDHRITGSQDHRITGSQDHRITGSQGQDHRLMSWERTCPRRGLACYQRMPAPSSRLNTG
ncbi:hypothetical protein EGV01_01670 [Pseudomonas syringae pv. theae]|nr:hypothetical protein [Pseudomonas syringae pv. theae]